MKLQILGVGCARCNALAMAAEEAAQSLAVEYQIERVTDLEHMVGLGARATPALAVDGDLKVEGRVPSMEEIKKILAFTERASDDDTKALVACMRTFKN
jgi:small redox-active disulfide protein 2